MNQADVDELKAVVERIHRCPATYRATERVRDRDQTTEVVLFDILGHPRALVCYAWFETVGSGRRRAITVLREGPIYTSVDAVRSAAEDSAE